MDLRLRATLGASSSYCPQPATTITGFSRGATGKIDFELSYCSADSIDELIFILKQDRSIYCYTMIDYLVETEDTEFLDKDYYEIIETDPETNQCSVKLVSDKSGSPVGYYELGDDKVCTKKDTLWTLDKHFEIADNIISLVLDPKETAVFKPTTPDDNVKFEINLRLGDYVIIEPQLSIAVFDSLSSEI